VKETAVFQRDAHAAGVANHFGGASGHHQLHVAARHRRVAQRRTKQAVLEHDSERIVIGGGIEDEAAGLQAVADPDRSDRATLALQPFADADRLQHSPRGAGDSGGAAIILRRQLGRGIGRIDDDAGDAVPVERDGEGEPNQPPAKDNDVRTIHFPALAMQRRNAKRRRRA
jgi:hypothetical protein